MNNPASADNNNSASGPNLSVMPSGLSYDKTDSLFFLLSLVLGYFFSLFVGRAYLGVSITLFTVIFEIYVWTYFRFKKIAVRSGDVFTAVLILIFSCGFFTGANLFVKFLNLLFIIFLSVYWIYCACGNRQSSVLDDMFVFDMLKAVFVLPFGDRSKYRAEVGAYRAGRNTGKKTDPVKAAGVILGIFIAIPVTLVIGRQLILADAAFSGIMESIFSNISIELSDMVIRTFFRVLFGVPVGMYLFSLLYASRTKKCADTLTREKNISFLGRLAGAPRAMFYTAITPVILLYLLFFVSQLAYFTSAFQNILPQGLSAAEYARSGFFELCRVAVINLLIILAIALFAQKKDGKTAAAVKLYIVILALFTLCLIFTAQSKMLLYIDLYGLTLLRVYTMWFMVLLTFIFLIIIIKQFWGKLNFIKTVLIGFVICFAVLVFFDIDGAIAKYNIEAYHTGKLDTVDVHMFYELSDSAIPHARGLLKDESEQVRTTAKEYILNKEAFYKEHKQSWLDFNLISYFALQK